MESLSHHKKAVAAVDRPAYRDARWEKAVKVYTINQESRYLLVQDVHSLGVTDELRLLFSAYGNIEEHRLLDEYPSEPYTEVHLIKFASTDNARFAKRKTDNRSFYGKDLHVCYAPEYESVQDTREKLRLRREVIARKTRGQVSSGSSSGTAASSTDPTTTPTPSTSHVTTTPGSSHLPPPLPQTASSLIIPPLFPSPPPPPHLSSLLPPPPSPLPSNLSSLVSSESPNIPALSSSFTPTKSVSVSDVPGTARSAVNVTVPPSISGGVVVTGGLSRGQRLAAYWSGDTAASEGGRDGMQWRGSGRGKGGRGHKGRGEGRFSSLPVPQRPPTGTSQHPSNTSGAFQHPCGTSRHLAGTGHHSTAPVSRVHGPPPGVHQNPIDAHKSSGLATEHDTVRPLPVFQGSPMSGDVSLDKSISMARERLYKVFDPVEDPSLSQLKHKPKKRKRI